MECWNFVYNNKIQLSASVVEHVVDMKKLLKKLEYIIRIELLNVNFEVRKICAWNYRHPYTCTYNRGHTCPRYLGVEEDPKIGQYIEWLCSEEGGAYFCP